MGVQLFLCVNEAWLLCVHNTLNWTKKKCPLGLFDALGKQQKVLYVLKFCFLDSILVVRRQKEGFHSASFFKFFGAYVTERLSVEMLFMHKNCLQYLFIST